ncbi:c-type cytochrome [Sphingosinicella terrae]|uniref:c-type cytochrome n=1 Tax=Sphingosinicella terrae TaxID=2172047 RepID=UPI000E0CF526|nr:cytochrome C [Sphingosinicella terrae]
MEPSRRRPLPVPLAIAFALAGCGGADQPSPPPGPGGQAPPSSAFAICSTCHTIGPGQNRLGPTLHGVVGRGAGSLPDFAYSPAMRDSGIVWTPETLDRFLADPRGTVPGNRMAFAGLADDARRRQLIDYLTSLGAAPGKVR